MDSRVTIKFFYVEGADENTTEFVSVLKEIAEIKSLKDRIRNANLEDAGEIKVRLERFGSDGDFSFGEFTRLQTENIPPEVKNDGLTPVQLADGIGLGHVAAFRFHAPTSILALQINPTSITHKSLVNYMMSYKDAAKYLFTTVLNRNVWEKFETTEPRSFEVAVASPQNLPAVEYKNQLVIDGFQKFGETLEGHVIKLGASIGGKLDDRLNKNRVRDLIRLFLGFKEDDTADVRSVKVGTDLKNDAGNYEEINFLREFLVERTELDLPSDDSVKNYDLRETWIKRMMDKHVDYLTEFYG